jgi:hypothetical protein
MTIPTIVPVAIPGVWALALVEELGTAYVVGWRLVVENESPRTIVVV